MTEYYDASVPKTGFMRIKLKSNYKESVRQDEEKVFGDNYEFFLTYAYYPSSTMAYAVGINYVDGTTYVI